MLTGEIFCEAQSDEDIIRSLSPQELKELMKDLSDEDKKLVQSIIDKKDSVSKKTPSNDIVATLKAELDDNSTEDEELVKSTIESISSWEEWQSISEQFKNATKGKDLTSTLRKLIDDDDESGYEHVVYLKKRYNILNSDHQGVIKLAKESLSPEELKDKVGLSDEEIKALDALYVQFGKRQDTKSTGPSTSTWDDISSWFGF